MSAELPDFDSLYRDHAEMVYNLCLHYLGRREEAEEACQDIFVRISERRGQFRGESSPKTWIYRISVRLCLDRLKARRRRRVWTWLGGWFGSEEKPVEPIDRRHPGIELEEREALGQVFAAIDRLPDNPKTALLLKAVEGLPQKDIAAVMQLSEKAVESLLSRAKAGLKIKLEGGEGKPPEKSSKRI